MKICGITETHYVVRWPHPPSAYTRSIKMLKKAKKRATLHCPCMDNSRAVQIFILHGNMIGDASNPEWTPDDGQFIKCFRCGRTFDLADICLTYDDKVQYESQHETLKSK